MHSVPISSCFYVMNPQGQIDKLNADIQALEAAAAQDPAHAALYQEEIQEDQNQINDINTMVTLAAEYRKTDNDPTLSKEINDVSQDETENQQLRKINAAIIKLEQEIEASAGEPWLQRDLQTQLYIDLRQKDLVQEIQSLKVEYSKTGNPKIPAELNALMQELTELVKTNPNSPLTKMDLRVDAFLFQG